MLRPSVEGVRRSTPLQSTVLKVSPKVTVIFVGEDNRFGHPHQGDL